MALGYFPGGTITSVSMYFAAKTGTSAMNAQLLIYDAGGNVIGQTGTFSVAAGSGGIGGQSWYTANLTSPLTLAANTYIYAGFYRDPAKSHEMSAFSGGNFLEVTDTGASPIQMFGYNVTSGTLGVYVTYTPASTGGIKVYNGSGWSKYKVKVWTGAAWQWCPVRIWNGSAWQRFA